MRFIVLAAAAAMLAGAAYAQTPPKIQISPDVPRETGVRCRALRMMEIVLIRKPDRPDYVYAQSARNAWAKHTADPEPPKSSSPLVDLKGPLERAQKSTAENTAALAEIEATPEYKADRLGTISKLATELCKPLETVVG